jgi:fermentation-respiration switch protein FrsA (DUF1100 family)
VRIAIASLLFIATAALAATAPSVPEGIWLGTIDAQGVRLKLAFHVSRSATGALSATMDSLSQSATGIVVDKVVYTAPRIRLEVHKLGVIFEGEVRGDELSGTFMQGPASLPLSLRHVALLEPPRRPQEPRRPFPYREEEVTISVPVAYASQRSGSVQLAGTLTLPPGKGPFPAVLFITGSGAQDRDETVCEHKPFLVLADALTRAGIATLRFDDRGTGRSGGSLNHLTTLDNARDTIEELAVLTGRPEIDRGAIGLIGHSEGGLVAPIVAAQSVIPRFLVLLAGTGMKGLDLIQLQDDAIARAEGKKESTIQHDRKINEKLLRLVLEEPDPKKLEARVRAALADDPDGLKTVLPQLPLMTTPWVRTFLTLDPVAYLKQVKVSVLALNGALDTQVDVSNLRLIEAALRAGGNRDVTVAALPGLNHLFQHARTGAPNEYVDIEETMSPEVIEKVRDYVRARARR